MAGESETSGLGSRHCLVRSLGKEPEPSAPPSVPVILRRKRRPKIGGPRPLAKSRSDLYLNRTCCWFISHRFMITAFRVSKHLRYCWAK